MTINNAGQFFSSVAIRHEKPTLMHIRLNIFVFIFFLFLPLQSSLANEWFYTVRPGDNLWNISDRYLTRKEYAQQLLKLNQVKSSGNLQPGTKLRIPILWLKQQPSSSRVINAKGQVTIIRAAGQQPDSSDDNIHLFVGDTIITGADGNATLEFADKSRLLIQPDSELVMDTLSTYGDSGMVDTRLRLPAGRVETQVTPKKGPASRYEITTPTAVAAVRGTDFRVSADTEKPISRSEVLEGTVAVSGGSDERDIPSGYGTVTERGKPPIEPKKLLPAPGTSGTQKMFMQLPLKFTWQNITDAQSYRAQIYPSTNFDSLLLDRQIDKPSIQIDTLPDNDYVLRIRAVDNLGLEGINQDHAFTVNAQPAHPDINEPVNNAILRDIRPFFSWTDVNKAGKYHLQIAEDNTFTSMIYDIPANKGNQFRPATPLPEKNLYWRVASVDIDGFDGPFSNIMMFQIRPLPGIPEFTRVEYDHDIMTFNWRKTGENIQYLFQMATDSKFENIFLQKTTDKNDLTIPRPSSDIYYYRIRAFSKSGESSDFNETTLIHVRPLNYNTRSQP